MKLAVDPALLMSSSVLVGVVYVYTMYPSIPGGDSGELIAAAHELGVAHPPGYPLFTLMIWLSIKLVPFGTVAWKANLLNALLSVAASGIFTLVVYKYCKSIGVSLFGAWIWSFSKLTWTWATCVEVFSLNNLFIVALLYLMRKFEQADRKCKTHVACIGAFLCGLSLCNQHTSVVYIAVIAVWVLVQLFKSKLLTWRSVCWIGLYFLLGLVPYIYLPLASLYSPGRWTWGDQSAAEGFFKHVLRQEYGTFSLAKGQDSDYKLIDGIMAYLDHVLTEYTLITAVLALLGAVSAVKRQIHSLMVSMVMCTIYLLLFSWRANLSLSNPVFHGVVERFWMQADIVVILLAALGLWEIYRQVERFISQQMMLGLQVAVAVAALASQMGRNFSECNHHTDTVVSEFGSRLYHNMPKNALVLTVGDLPSNVLRYTYLCDNDRPDVTVLDQELMTYGWFVPMLRRVYPTVKFPGHHMEKDTGRMENGQRVFNFKTFLDANYDKRPLVGCIGVQSHENSWKQGYSTFPYGPCSLLLKTDRAVDLQSVQQGAQNISAGWTYPYKGFDAKSWERVATDEMWNAKISIAYQLFDMALKLKETGSQYEELVTKSYQMYKEAVRKEKTADIPDYWHRNYALACERMLRIKHTHSNSDILQDTIKHFELYVEKKPTDESIPLIERSIVNLKSYVGKL